MIASVKERKENSSKFRLCYEDICKMQNRMPLPSVKVHLKKDILDFDADRVTFDEWGPILNALSLDKSLHFIGIRSTHSGKAAMEDIVTESKARAIERRPVIQTRYILMMLMRTLRMCMSNSTALTCMELEGLPLTHDYLEELIWGITSCLSLKNISFYRSPIGDEGCEMLCSGLKDLVNVNSIDLSVCHLTAKGALSISELIKYQKIQRYSESWKHTLRYRKPDLDSLPGLRRITLNHNPDIGNEGISHIVDVIKDDLFVKALDLQNCGVGNAGGKVVLEMLQTNVSIAIVDLRVNQDLSADLLKQIMSQLNINNKGKCQEYHWIAVDRLHLPRQTSKRGFKPPIPRRVLSAKADMRISSPITLPKRSKSGIPWRISVRLDKRREGAIASPGTPRAVQFQDSFPPYNAANVPSAEPYRVELEEARLQILWLTDKLDEEMKLRKKVEDEKQVLQKRLGEIEGHSYVLVEKQTMNYVDQLCKDYHYLIQSLKKMGLGVLLDRDMRESLDKMNTNEKSNLAYIIRKSYSANIMRDKSNQTELHKISKSASAFRNVGKIPLHLETGIGDAEQRVMSNVALSSEGTVGTLTYQACSSDSNEASGEDSDVLLPRDHISSHRNKINTGMKKKKKQDDANNALYQTVMLKNLELEQQTEGLYSNSESFLSQDHTSAYNTQDEYF